MALTKVNYIDNETAITADQMNAIQDEIIANGEKFQKFGLGTNGSTALDNDANKIAGNGFFRAYVNTPNEDVWWNILNMDCYDGDSNASVQIANGYISSDIASICVRQKYAGKFGEWGWLNPPMLLGVEYRTTERFMGKPVYRMLFDFGTMPNKTYKTMSYYPTWDAVQPISAVGILNSGGTHTIFPTVNYSGTAGEISLKVQSNNITISASSDIDMSGKTAYVDVKYIYK